MNRKWYAIYTKPHSEKKVMALLQKKKIEGFCAMNRLSSNHPLRRKAQQVPLFPSIVFAHLTKQEIVEVRRMPDVINFLYWLGKPAVIKGQEIQNIAHFSDTYFNIRVEKTMVNHTAMISITHEPLVRNGYDFPPVNNTIIKLSLPSLGYHLIASTQQPVAGGVRLFKVQKEILN